MTAPRQVLPGVTYLITRRCLDRMFLLRPSPLVNAVFEYALAAKAKEYGILLHAYCVLSNHWHCVLTDTRGCLPEFQRDVGSTVARALNAGLGKWEYFWAPGSYSAVALQTPEDVLDKMAYVKSEADRRGGSWLAGPRRRGPGPTRSLTILKRVELQGWATQSPWDRPCSRTARLAEPAGPVISERTTLPARRVSAPVVTAEEEEWPTKSSSSSSRR